MSRPVYPVLDRQTIYDIYRGCRLCGAGKGYKMPILRNIRIDDSGIELRQKIRECVQIEVYEDDKMPPLICELCMDKVMEYYDFLELCRQTNVNTRKKLGLPMQTVSREAPETGDCILGVTETVYDSDREPLSSKKGKRKKDEKKKGALKIKIKLENPHHEDRKKKEVSSSLGRSSKYKRRSPTPPRRLTRNSITEPEEKSRKVTRNSIPITTPPKSILKKDIKTEDSPSSRLKRSREKEVKLDVPTKRVKIKPPPPKSQRSARPASKRSSSPVAHAYACSICDTTSKSSQRHSLHMRSHAPTFTDSKLACNACEEWFSGSEEATKHHRRHKMKRQPYICRRCDESFTKQELFDEHLEDSCVPYDEVPDVKCDECWRMFATQNLLDDHKCPGPDGRLGGKCKKCNRNYALLRNLTKHEAICTARKKDDFVIDEALLRKLRPIRVRVAKCDPLLKNMKRRHYDVSNVDDHFGLDKSYDYPFISSFKIKSEPGVERFDGMVRIQQDVQDEFFVDENYVHWDSDDSSDSGEDSSFGKRRKVDSLSTLTLKTIFSKKFLGRVPRKLRTFKNENRHIESDSEINKSINSIIKNLDMDDEEDDLNKCSSLETSVVTDSVGKDIVCNDPKVAGTNDLDKGDKEEKNDCNSSADASVIADSVDKDMESDIMCNDTKIQATNEVQNIEKAVSANDDTTDVSISNENEKQEDTLSGNGTQIGDNIVTSTENVQNNNLPIGSNDSGNDDSQTGDNLVTSTANKYPVQNDDVSTIDGDDDLNAEDLTNEDSVTTKDDKEIPQKESIPVNMNNLQNDIEKVEDDETAKNAGTETESNRVGLDEPSNESESGHINERNTKKDIRKIECDAAELNNDETEAESNTVGLNEPSNENESVPIKENNTQKDIKQADCVEADELNDETVKNDVTEAENKSVGFDEPSNESEPIKKNNTQNDIKHVEADEFNDETAKNHVNETVNEINENNLKENSEHNMQTENPEATTQQDGVIKDVNDESKSEDKIETPGNDLDSISQDYKETDYCDAEIKENRNEVIDSSKTANKIDGDSYEKSSEKSLEDEEKQREVESMNTGADKSNNLNDADMGYGAEMDDKKLMEALDAEIGECNDIVNINDSNASYDKTNDSSGLEELIKNRNNDLKPVDFEEFNFDV